MILKDDEDAWNQCDSRDLWIFDKLLVSKKLGYVCGPHGVDVPVPDTYIIRPCVNIMGMGDGARFQHLEKKTDNLIPAGTFWCEVFEGPHYSVDYRDGKQVRCTQGIRSSDDLWKWDRWIKVDRKISLPYEILNDLHCLYPKINAEYIGDNLIEIHLRGNSDWDNHDGSIVIPHYHNDDLDLSNRGYTFIPDPCKYRKGFWYGYQVLCGHWVARNSANDSRAYDGSSDAITRK